MPGESSAKITIDGDAKSYIDEAERAKKATHEVAHAAAHVGTSIEEWTGHFAKSLISIHAIGHAIEAAAAATNKAMADAGAASEKAGKQTLDRGIAGARLGLSSQLINNITSGSPQSADTMTTFLTELAGAKRNNGAAVDSGSAIQSLQLMSSGLFDKSEVMDAVHGVRGAPSLQQLAGMREDRMKALGEEGLAELATRTQVNAAEEGTLEAQQKDLRFGVAMPTRTLTAKDARVGKARSEQTDAEHPWLGLTKSALGGIPIIGKAIKESIEQENTMSGAGIPYFGGKSDLSGKIEEQTKFMRDSVNPTVGPGADFH